MTMLFVALLMIGCGATSILAYRPHLSALKSTFSLARQPATRRIASSSSSSSSSSVLSIHACNGPMQLKIAASIISLSLMFPSSSWALAQQYKLPPIDKADKNRCVLTSSSMGQANAARDKLYDLRECDLQGQDGSGKDMSGMIAANADFSKVRFKDAQISKAYAKNGKFVACDFTNAVVDRVVFDGSDLSKAIFTNAVLSGTTFTDANLKDTDFTDSYLGPFDLKNLCDNPTLAGTNPVTGNDSKLSAGCLE